MFLKVRIPKELVRWRTKQNEPFNVKSATRKTDVLGSLADSPIEIGRRLQSRQIAGLKNRGPQGALSKDENRRLSRLYIFSKIVEAMPSVRGSCQQSTSSTCSDRGTRRLLGRCAARQLSRCKAKHEPRNPRHQQVHAYKYPNGPRRTRRPVEPDQTAEQERNQSIHK